MGSCFFSCIFQMTDERHTGQGSKTKEKESKSAKTAEVRSCSYSPSFDMPDPHFAGQAPKTKEKMAKEKTKEKTKKDCNFY